MPEHRTRRVRRKSASGEGGLKSHPQVGEAGERNHHYEVARGPYFRKDAGKAVQVLQLIVRHVDCSCCVAVDWAQSDEASETEVNGQGRRRRCTRLCRRLRPYTQIGQNTYSGATRHHLR